ncbi:MAG: ABC-2 family transporter protein, partial [Oscillospiraceae bacterium]|nr:ABC-2 family transporter protein [Oscillospiraceae bacterium]
YGHFVKYSIMEQLEYKANFFIGIAVECTWLVTKLLYVFITQTTGALVGGHTPDEIMLYVGVFMILTALQMSLFAWNFFFFSWGVNRGDLDLIMVKPVSLMFMSTTRFVNISVPIPNIIGGSVLIAVAWGRLGLQASALNILLFLHFMLAGLVVSYSLFFIPHLSAFWTLKTNGITELSNGLWDFNNMPMQIYNKWWQRLGVFVIPVFVITNFPVMALFDNLTSIYLLWGLIVPILAFVLIRVLWKIAIRKYSSAGG